MEQNQKIMWKIVDGGQFELVWNGVSVLCAYAASSHTDGRKIDTRQAVLTEKTELSDGWKLTYSADNGLVLTEYLKTVDGKAAQAYCVLSENGKDVESRQLIPLIFHGADRNVLKIWKSMWTKMLMVPYDNTMWSRYEALPLNPGRRSYDLTVLFDESSKEGLLVGAGDFSVWKNALTCSGSDARHLEAESGVADKGTHDTVSHGTMSGLCVKSAPFWILYGKDYRDLLEQYGDLLAADRMLTWKQGVSFGFNSWAAVAKEINEDTIRDAGKFLKDKLRPGGYENKGICYVNFDDGWQVMTPETVQKLVDDLHAQGHRAGIYDAPFAYFGQDTSLELEGAPGYCYNDILLRDSNGNPLPRLDGACPLDVTHPIWKKQMEWKLNRFADWGFDYIKLDFMSHGASEGAHYNPDIHTGRQAIAEGYRWIIQNLNPEKIGRDFFISLSIAPLFPHGYGHSRRISCDAFGTNEDVEYVLNASTYAWWQHGRLYSFNDPDHICLFRSFDMERESTMGEARARYTASAVSGTVMMISDDYRKEEAVKRTKLLTSNQEVNAVARSGKAFRPAKSAGYSACSVFTAEIDGRQYAAVFHWMEKDEEVWVDCAQAQISPDALWKELWSGEILKSENGILKWHVSGCDAALLKEVK